MIVYVWPVLFLGLAIFIGIWGWFVEKEKALFGLSLALLLLVQAFVCLLFPVFRPQAFFPAAYTRSAPHAGHLHNATWQEWKSASVQNRLATATDYLQDLRKQGLFLARIRGVDEYRPWAAALVSCMEWEYTQQNGPPPKVVARECLAEGKIQRFYKP